jgi:anti-sigma regulatory factor (Ser/Thr protein kinase)
VTLGGRTVELFFDRDASSVAGARAAVVDELAGHFSDELVDRGELLVSELMANALRHGQGPPYLCVHREPSHVRVEVGDDGPTLEALDTSGPGYGLRILEAFADRWGLESAHDDGKKVWFELDSTDLF